MYCSKCGKEALEEVGNCPICGGVLKIKRSNALKRLYYDYKTIMAISIMSGLAALLVVPLLFGIIGVTFGYVVFVRGYKNYGIALIIFSSVTFIIGSVIDIL